MGFTPKSKIYVLDFTGDDELDGLTVRARSSSIGALMDISGLAATFKGGEVDDVTAVAEFGKLIEAFADVLVSWDLELQPGVPTPPDASGLRRMEFSHFLRLITAWQGAVSDVPAPLPQPSSSGTPSLEGSLPMEPLSSSLAS